jgi:hypothetical protein
MKQAFDLSAVLQLHDQIAIDAFVKAAGDGDIEKINSFISRYGVEHINAVNVSGFTALHEAAFAGQYEVIELLLKLGAKVDSRDRNGKTPLMLAAMKGNTACVTALLNAGADPEARDNTGRDVLWIARGGPIQMSSISGGAVALIEIALIPKQRGREAAARAAAAKAAQEREEQISQQAKDAQFLKRPMSLPPRIFKN